LDFCLKLCQIPQDDFSTRHVCYTSRPYNYPKNLIRPGILTRSGSDTRLGKECHLQRVWTGSNMCPCKLASLAIYTIHNRLTLHFDGRSYEKGQNMAVVNVAVKYKAHLCANHCPPLLKKFIAHR
jgi:hypothetical protein